MTTFDDRKQAFENKYAHDQEFHFKVTVRRNKLLGLWLAAQLGKTDVEADAYAAEVIQSDFDRPGDGDVVEKVMADIETAGLEITEHDIRAQMLVCFDEARALFMNDV